MTMPVPTDPQPPRPTPPGPPGAMKCDGCDLMSVDGAHFDDHCRVGEHCTSIDAGCAASRTVDDHSTRCCICKQPVSEPTNRSGYPLGEDLRETMASALGLDVDEGWLAIALVLMEQAASVAAPRRERADDGYMTSLEDFRRDVVMALCTEDGDEERTDAEAVARVRDLVMRDRIDREIRVPADNLRTNLLIAATAAVREVDPGYEDGFDGLADAIRGLARERAASGSAPPGEPGPTVLRDAALVAVTAERDRLVAHLTEGQRERDESRSAPRLIADKLDIAQAATPQIIADITVRYIDAVDLNLANALEAAETAQGRISTLSGIADGERELRAAQLERERDQYREAALMYAAEVGEMAQVLGHGGPPSDDAELVTKWAALYRTVHAHGPLADVSGEQP